MTEENLINKRDNIDPELQLHAVEMRNLIMASINNTDGPGIYTEESTSNQDYMLSSIMIGLSMVMTRVCRKLVESKAGLADDPVAIMQKSMDENTLAGILMETMPICPNCLKARIDGTAGSCTVH